MAMQATITEAERAALPEAVRGHYRQDGDHWRLEVTGDETAVKLKVADERVGEFRENNVRLMRENEALRTERALLKQAADEASALKETHANLKQVGVKGPDDVAVLRQRIEGLERERDEALEHGRAQAARGALLKAAQAAGVRPEAADALVLLAQRDGLCQTPATGETVFLKPDGTAKLTDSGGLLTPESWVQAQRKNGGAFLFKPNRGTGGQSAAGPTPDAGGDGYVRVTGESGQSAMRVYTSTAGRVDRGPTTITI